MPFLRHAATRSGRELGALLFHLAQAGFRNPITPVDTGDAFSEGVAPVRRPRIDVAEDWRLIREREGESYQ